MDITGLETIRQSFGLSASDFAGVLAAAEGQCSREPLNEAAHIYSACAAAIEEKEAKNQEWYETAKAENTRVIGLSSALNSMICMMRTRQLNISEKSDLDHATRALQEYGEMPF